jgi:soluble lytic murein transglycosylase-like protein
MIEDTQGNRVFVNANTPLPQPPSLAPASGAASSGARPLGFRQVIQKESRQAKIDPKLVRAIIKVESDGNPRAVSPKGAQGLMQLIPATARRFGVDNAFDPSQNIRGGVTYLRYLLNLFNGNLPLTLAAYDAGENRVIEDGGIPRIPETRNYVQKVTALYHAQQASNLPGQASGPAPPVVYQYVDSSGVVHFATGDDDLPACVQLAANGNED